MMALFDMNTMNRNAVDFLRFYFPARYLGYGTYVTSRSLNVDAAVVVVDVVGVHALFTF